MNSSRILWLVLLGSLLGGLGGMLQPRAYLSEVTLYFPAVHPKLLANLTQALRAEPDSVGSLPGAGSLDVSQIAITILRSQAAAEYALNQAGISSASRWQGDPVQELQQGLQIEAAEPATVVVKVRWRSASRAKDLGTGLLDYYHQFTKKTPLTRVRQAREACELRLTQIRKQLTRMEEQLSRSASRDLRSLGDASLKVNPKVMSEVWMRRVDEEGRSRELLDKMQKVRGNPPATDPDEKWLAEWAAGRKLGVKTPKALLRTPVRRQDILERARLERDYYEALLKHRSLVLQHSYLRTWEALENPDFEIIDPQRVHSLRAPIVNWVLGGAVAGALLGVLFWIGRRRR
ncbi:hypothetical protein IV102_19835 [bacterium]|nr:hypothetical protein [bacterium]